MKHTTQIGLIGLGVMGGNLARNFANNGVRISIFNRNFSKTQEFLKQYPHENLIGFEENKDFIESLESPRSILLLVPSGKAVDEVVQSIVPFLEKGDTIIDCGNSFYGDTQKRQIWCDSFGINFIGCGISGGEEGALHGPSIMPGGKFEAITPLLPLFEKISAKDFQGDPCVSYIGNGGSGHFVKMVHNGIEYAIMQMIVEIYGILQRIYGLAPSTIADIFRGFDSPELQSYLCEITSKILEKKDEFHTDDFLVNYIQDRAGAKGTGLWSSHEGLERGIDISTISQATFARINSGRKHLREKLDLSSKTGTTELTHLSFDSKSQHALEHTLRFGVLMAYSQGIDLIIQASEQEKWGIRLSEIARIWQGGCIIRSQFLLNLEEKLKEYEINGIESLLEIPEIRNRLDESCESVRYTLNLSNSYFLPTPSTSSALQSYFQMIQNRSQASLIQAMRDYFGAHTYERTDREGIFHTQW